jgi:flagellar protein FlaG
MRTDLLTGTSQTYSPVPSSAATAQPAPLTPVIAPANTASGAPRVDPVSPSLIPNAAAPVGNLASASTANNDTSVANAADAAALKKSVDVLNRYIQPQQGSIEFSLDDSSGKTLLKVVDTETNKVLLQIPSKQALALAESLGTGTGQLIRDSA